MQRRQAAEAVPQLLRVDMKLKGSAQLERSEFCAAFADALGIGPSTVHVTAVRDSAVDSMAKFVSVLVKTSDIEEMKRQVGGLKGCWIANYAVCQWQGSRVVAPTNPLIP